jgi:hypothetical protein
MSDDDIANHLGGDYRNGIVRYEVKSACDEAPARCAGCEAAYERSGRVQCFSFCQMECGVVAATFWHGVPHGGGPPISEYIAPSRLFR